MPDEPLIVTEVIHGYAGRLAWHGSPDGRILFDKKDEQDPERWFDLWSMTPGGNIRECLTRDKPRPFTRKHLGQPSWHPAGTHVVYQASKNLVQEPYSTSPGCGWQNDLYIMPADASTTYCVYESVLGSGGVLHPHFNAAGTKLAWSELVSLPEGSLLGHWVLQQARVYWSATGVPYLENIQTSDPGDKPDWLECHGYDVRDDGVLLVSGNCNGEHAFGSNIYAYDSTRLRLTRLTDNRKWEEHAHVSPDGEWIVFMRGLQDLMPLAYLESELWIMRRDGSDQRQLTHFHEPGHPHFVSETGVVVADNDWSPDGREIALFTQSPESSQGEIRICAVHLDAL